MRCRACDREIDQGIQVGGEDSPVTLHGEARFSASGLFCSWQCLGLFGLRQVLGDEMPVVEVDDDEGWPSEEWLEEMRELRRTEGPLVEFTFVGGPFTKQGKVISAGENLEHVDLAIEPGTAGWDRLWRYPVLRPVMELQGSIDGYYLARFIKAFNPRLDRHEFMFSPVV